MKKKHRLKTTKQITVLNCTNKLLNCTKAVLNWTNSFIKINKNYRQPSKMSFVAEENSNIPDYL